MPTDTKLKELIINELTEEQYKALTPDDDELYLTPDGSITKNENGSYVLDGDVDITGTTKLNSGIKPIHEYNVGAYKLQVLFEKENLVEGYSFFTGFGYIVDDQGYSNSAMFCYQVLNGNVLENSFVAIDFSCQVYTVTESGVDRSNFLYDIESKQECLYTHTLTLTADKSYTLVYLSTDNLEVASISDLRTIMNVTESSDNVILPVCATDLSGTAVLQVTTTLCKIGAANVTAVSDKVITK